MTQYVRPSCKQARLSLSFSAYYETARYTWIDDTSLPLVHKRLQTFLVPVQDGEITLQLIILVVIHITFQELSTALFLRCSPIGTRSDCLHVCVHSPRNEANPSFYFFLWISDVGSANILIYFIFLRLSVSFCCICHTQDLRDTIADNKIPVLLTVAVSVLAFSSNVSAPVFFMPQFVADGTEWVFFVQQ